MAITTVTTGRQRRNVGSERKEKEKLERMRQRKREEFERQVFSSPHLTWVLTSIVFFRIKREKLGKTKRKRREE